MGWPFQQAPLHWFTAAPYLAAVMAPLGNT